MSRTLRLLNIGFLILISCKTGTAIMESAKPLTAEQVQVYGDFLERFNKLNFTSLSDRTFPFDLSTVNKNAFCLQGLEFEGTSRPDKSIHLLTANVLRGRAIPLVGAQEEAEILKQRDTKKTTQSANSKNDRADTKIDLGVLALSEIVFDKSHHHAVLRYVLLCGARCNSGSVLVLEKVGSQWAPFRRACSATINQEKPRP